MGMDVPLPVQHANRAPPELPWSRQCYLAPAPLEVLKLDQGCCSPPPLAAITAAATGGGGLLCSTTSSDTDMAAAAASAFDSEEGSLHTTPSPSLDRKDSSCSSTAASTGTATMQRAGSGHGPLAWHFSAAAAAFEEEESGSSPHAIALPGIFGMSSGWLSGSFSREGRRSSTSGGPPPAAVAAAVAAPPAGVQQQTSGLRFAALTVRQAATPPQPQQSSSFTKGGQQAPKDKPATIHENLQQHEVDEPLGDQYPAHLQQQQPGSPGERRSPNRRHKRHARRSSGSGGGGGGSNSQRRRSPTPGSYEAGRPHPKGPHSAVAGMLLQVRRSLRLSGAGSERVPPPAGRRPSGGGGRRGSPLGSSQSETAATTGLHGVVSDLQQRPASYAGQQQQQQAAAPKQGRGSLLRPRLPSLTGGSRRRHAAAHPGETTLPQQQQPQAQQSAQQQAGAVGAGAEGGARPNLHLPGPLLERLGTTLSAQLQKLASGPLGEWMFGEYGGKELLGEYEPLHQVLGSGSSGTTKLMIHRRSGRAVAAKTMHKSGIVNRALVMGLRREVAIMQLLEGHPQVVRLFGVYEDRWNINLVMEWCPGGSLLSTAQAAPGGRLEEEQVAGIMGAVLRALATCHACGILHRDVKPENFLLSAASCVEEEGCLGGRVKMADFGISIHLHPGQTCSELAGTLEYMAPEVLGRCYGLEADIWAAGVMAAQLLTGVLPFPGYTPKQVAAAQAANLPLDFSAPHWAGVSPTARTLVSLMLTSDRHHRPSAAQLLTSFSEWLECGGAQ